ncbi:MAG: hypothetical protein ACP5N2_07485 [Candidatus Nanoarchaeia archaeon]
MPNAKDFMTDIALKSEFEQFSLDAIRVGVSASDCSSKEPLQSQGFYTCSALILESILFNRTKIQKKGALFHFRNPSFNYGQKRDLISLLSMQVQYLEVPDYIRENIPTGVQSIKYLDVLFRTDSLTFDQQVEVISKESKGKLRGRIIHGMHNDKKVTKILQENMCRLTINMEEPLQVPYKDWGLLYLCEESKIYTFSEKIIESKRIQQFNKYDLFKDSNF